MKDNEIICSYCGTLNSITDGNDSCICEFCGKEVKRESKKEEIPVPEVKIPVTTEANISKENNDTKVAESQENNSKETEIDRLFAQIVEQYQKESKAGFAKSKRSMIILLAVFMVIFIVSMIMMVSYFSHLGDAVMHNAFMVMDDSEQIDGGSNE